VGFPTYFHVPNGHKVLQHPLYLQFNQVRFEDLDPDEIKTAINGIMMTNDNMAILWYLNNMLSYWKVANN